MYLLHTLFAVLGRLFGQTIGGRREVDARRRELRVQFLVDAWRNLARAGHQHAHDDGAALRQALADVQLFGTPAQVDQAAAVARSLTVSGDVDALDDLLE